MLVLVNTQLITAQKNSSLNETIFIHTNTTTFVTGENLLYKIYCLKSSNKRPSIISKVAYVELISSDKKSVFKSKIALKNGIGNSDYFIPITLNSGNYKLIAYTSWMLNKEITEIFTIDLTIFNPYKTNTSINSRFQKTDSVLVTSSSVNEPSKSTSKNKNLNVVLNKTIYQNRELVTLKIESIASFLEMGSYSLTVRKVDELPITKQKNSAEFSTLQTESFIDLEKEKIQLPELRGEIVSGKISAKNKFENVANINVALSLPGKSFDFKIAKTNSKGEFIFNINQNALNNEVTIQIIGNSSQLYDILLDRPIGIDLSKISVKNEFNLSENLRKALNERSTASQIRNAYYDSFKDSVAIAKAESPFYDSTAKAYILDDFTRFKTLKETVTEIVTEMYLKQNGNNTFVHVNDPSVFPQLAEPALVLVDGLFQENQNDLSKYNMKHVYKIELISGRFYVGPKSFNGFVSFTTFKNDFTTVTNESYILKTTILRPEKEKIYNKVVYLDNTENKRIPDYRYQLLWEPHVTITSRESSFTFYTSDVTGNFEINLEGFTEKGEPVSIFKNFEVN